MKVALIQFDPTVGDVAGNATRAADLVRQAQRDGAHLVVFPELAICGYPPRDLLLRQGMAEACERAVALVAAAATSSTVLIGSPRAVQGGARPVANSVAVLQQGRLVRWYDKRLLPTYDVFDEDRYFAPGREPCVVEVAVPGGPAARVGVLVCEDLWRAQDVLARAEYAVDPLMETRRADATLMVALSASPFEQGKGARHEAMLAEAAARAGVPVASVNQFGGYDDLIFDGDVRMVWPSGAAWHAPRWQAGCHVVSAVEPASHAVSSGGPLRDLWDALVCGTRAYLARTGHREAVVGLSGGIDSAFVCTLAAAALGPGRVIGVLMPSRWSSVGSVSDARDLAERLGVRTLMLPIGDAHTQLAGALDAELVSAGLPGVAGLVDENLQSRLRGLQVMAVSNATGALVLTTGNKSEYAAGYTTLYGDMNGGLAPIGDVLKTEVWALSRWVNAHAAECGFRTAPIPEASIEKPPSAELRPNQTDQDTLPPYEALDAIVRAWVDEECSVEETVARTGLAEDVVRHWTQAIDRAEFKRYQAAVILKVSPRAFGRGRRMPLAQRWRPA